MNHQVNYINGRMSLRQPQLESLEILARITDLIQLKKDADLPSALAAIRREFPTVDDFEREFPSLCFALATGVGKTRLMGAFISYLHAAHGINNFFVLAPNLTIYNKLITDFTPNTPKYVFNGIADFSTNSPAIITGDTYESMAGSLYDRLQRCRINIFNISKINSEVRGGKSPRIKRLSEYIGQSYFDYLAGLPDLVLLMDESHRYRAGAGVKAINELKPILGLELTATPYIEGSKGAVAFKNVIYDYPLSKAMEDGFVKEPAVVTRKDFDPAGMTHEEIERLKLEDGVRLHERVKTELETYARNHELPVKKPFMLVIARDTAHASQLLELIQSEAFFEGRYREKVIQVDSSQTGAAEDVMVERLLKVESAEEPTEIVVHVNMLKEGWDVNNLYTIVPLRAANARILIEQSIGRGLRLPYGRRTGVTAVDRLNIVAHDRFQEIIEEANRPDSPIHLQAVMLSSDHLEQRCETVVSTSNLETRLGLAPKQPSGATSGAVRDIAPEFSSPAEQQVARFAYEAVKKLSQQPDRLPSAAGLQQPEIQAAIVAEVTAQCPPVQDRAADAAPSPDVERIVAKTTALVIAETIDIPRLHVVPKQAIKCGFRHFHLFLDVSKFQRVSEELWVQHLRTSRRELVTTGPECIEGAKPEDNIVAALADFDDVSYDTAADLLYDLAGQAVAQFTSHFSVADARRMLQCYQREVALAIYDQMTEHYWEETVEFEVKVSGGFSALKQSAYSAVAGEAPLNFHQAPRDKSNMAKYLFSGFNRCLYALQKFQSDPERTMAVILDRDALKWFRPAKEQFQIYYKIGHRHHDYQPDFVAEADTVICMLEAKARDELAAQEVLAKQAAATTWCGHASEFSVSHRGKRWRYALIPHDVIAENMTLDGLMEKFGR